MKVDITKREALNKLLDALAESAESKWGVMRPQNMIEHLALVTEYTNGKKNAAQKTTKEEANALKQVIIYSDMEIPMGLKSPLAGEGPDPFRFANLRQAKNNFNKELDDFEAYFKNDPSATFIQPRFGPLNYNEWIIFHNKHITHHFKQFGLVE